MIGGRVRLLTYQFGPEVWRDACSSHSADSRQMQKMQPNEDPRKRPLLTPEQLQNMRRIPERVKKGNPREEFEKLFRLPAECAQA